MVRQGLPPGAVSVADVLEALGNGHIVFIVEGEKDADAMWDRGQPATTNAGGVKKWRDELNQFFAGADVVVIADNESPGRDHADDVACKLANVAARVRVLDLGKHWSACPAKGDISDFFQAGKTAEDLNAIVEQLPDWVAKGGSIGMSADNLCALEFAPQNYIVPGYIVEGLTLFAGKPKVGKSWLLCTQHWLSAAEASPWAILSVLKAMSCIAALRITSAGFSAA